MKNTEFRNFMIGALSTIAGWAIIKLLERYEEQKKTIQEPSRI